MPTESAVSWDATGEADVILADGSLATIRAVRADDGDRLRAFYAKVSDQSKYLRFFATHPELTAEDLHAWLDVDGRDRVTLVLTTGEQVVATARYAVVDKLLPERVADVSFLVQDDHQGKGAANILLEHLAQIGRESGIERFFAEMLTANLAMKQVFIRAGYDVRPELADGFISVTFRLDPTERSRLVMEQREHRAESASISRLLRPTSIAVVGSSARKHPLIESIVAGGYTGRLESVTGSSLDDEPHPAALLAKIDGPIDLVISEYHPAGMAELIAEAARHQARGLVVLARGRNPNVSASQAAELIAQARDHGLRVFGPASLGLVNHDPAVRLNATPVPGIATGPIGLFTQTAGVATLTLSRALARGTGLANFIASGAYADITANDVMQFWSDDEATKVCLLSLDSVGNPRKFIRVLRRLALEKHVVVFTPSRALQSARHHRTGDLRSFGPDALDSVIRSAGVMVVTRRDTMFDIAEILARQPVPRGRRVTVISNSSGLTHQMAQAARRFGLKPRAVTISDDPVSGLLIATEIALRSQTDAVITAAVEIGDPVLDRVEAGLRKLAATPRDVPLIGVSVGLEQRRPAPGTAPGAAPAADGEVSLPLFESYADALEALALIVDNEERRRDARPTPDDELAESGRARAQEIVDVYLKRHPDGGWLSDREVADLLGAYGVSIVPWAPVRSLNEAIAAAEQLGWDVVLKATHPMVAGRGELSTLVRSLGDADAMEVAWVSLTKLAESLGLVSAAELLPVVQPTVAPGTTLTARAIEDPVLGPLVSVGVAGIASELLGDAAFAAPPLRRADAARMLESLKAYPLISGYKGAPPVDSRRAEHLLMALARLGDEILSVVEVEATPVILATEGTSIVGARVRVAPLGTERDPLARVL